MILGVMLNNPITVAVEMRVAVVVVRFADESDEFVPLLVRLLAAVTVVDDRFVATVVLMGSGVVVLLLTVDILV